jgi:hypothetical protein
VNRHNRTPLRILRGDRVAAPRRFLLLITLVISQAAACKATSADREISRFVTAFRQAPSGGRDATFSAVAASLAYHRDCRVETGDVAGQRCLKRSRDRQAPVVVSNAGFGDAEFTIALIGVFDTMYTLRHEQSVITNLLSEPIGFTRDRKPAWPVGRGLIVASDHWVMYEEPRATVELADVAELVDQPRMPTVEVVAAALAARAAQEWTPAPERSFCAPRVGVASLCASVFPTDSNVQGTSDASPQAAKIQFLFSGQSVKTGTDSIIAVLGPIKLHTLEHAIRQLTARPTSSLSRTPGQEPGSVLALPPELISMCSIGNFRVQWIVSQLAYELIIERRVNSPTFLPGDQDIERVPCN